MREFLAKAICPLVFQRLDAGRAALEQCRAALRSALNLEKDNNFKIQRLEAQVAELVNKYVTVDEPQRFNVSPEWTEAHALELNRFFGTPAGAALCERLRAMVAAIAIEGCREPQDVVHRAGRAAGWEECTRKVLEMARAALFADPKDSISPAAGASAATNNRQAPGAAPLPDDGDLQELISRYAP